MDQYSFIRLVNFIRSSKSSSREVMDMDMPIWEQDKFMMPVIEDDALLMYGKLKSNVVVRILPLSSRLSSPLNT